ncbi:MAG: right-handed parallel beta-helix repeat-containing protein, partial [Planctomycetota bacterium]
MTIRVFSRSAIILASLAALSLGPAAVRAGDPYPLRSLDPPVLLPDGTEFRTWEAPPEHSRTYYVDGSDPAASDDNPGTAERPFRTIQRAADVLLPGERVIVRAGVYREHVRPRRGGEGPTRMIAYEAERRGARAEAQGGTRGGAGPGGASPEVLLKGSAVFRPEWLPSAPDGKTPVAGAWEAPLDRSLFDGYFPFEIENVTEKQFETMSWAAPLRGKPPCTLPRGLVFHGGRPLERVPSYEDLAGKDGASWFERARNAIHIRPFGGADPRRETFEITVRQTVFSPEEPGLGFIRVRGFTVEAVANPFPWEQVGAISTTRGHHWIIEENVVRWANGVGIDVGIQHPCFPQPPLVGFHIVRRNVISDCGICGIAGLGPGGGREFGLLIEENVLLRNAFLPVETLFETAAIKTHNNVRCLISGNFIADTLHGPGIWMDWDNRASRVSENAVLRTRAIHGAIFVEASFEPNLVAGNVIWDTSGHGIYEHDSTRQVFAHNFVGLSKGAAICLRGKVTDRKIAGRPIESGRHSVLGNVFFENGAENVFRGPGNETSGNVEEGVRASLSPDGSTLFWSLAGPVPRVPEIPGLAHDFLGARRDPGERAPGPLASVPREPAALPLGISARASAPKPPSYSGIYPHLAVSNDGDECGIGAVAPWAERLWFLTYSPHSPRGSSDKLYEIALGREAILRDLQLIARPESVGGTPANRLVHRESGQLFLGPYAIDARGGVRALRPDILPGRLTGAARHLLRPEDRIYLATMEEGFYEVDVRTLEVNAIHPDAQGQRPGEGADLPGCHGKGLYSGQGVLVYANNGEPGGERIADPRAPAGALLEWDGERWRLVRRAQFTEVTGPGGICGNAEPERDPIWSVGWDFRSLILMVREAGRWHAYRLPKASFSYDGLHGWHTEWPRIRDVGSEGRPDLLMTMHGMFWRFPAAFSAASARGIRPRSSYLKVVADFCRSGDLVVFGCDDAAKSQFLNRRRAKGAIAGPGRSQSNLWFVEPEALDRLGTTAACGAPWLRDPVAPGDVSEPFLFAGWPLRSAFLANDGLTAIRLALEVDPEGRGEWRGLRSLEIPAGGSVWTEFGPEEPGEWIRARALGGSASVSVVFTWGEAARRSREPDAIFSPLARLEDGPTPAGWVRAGEGEDLPLELAALSFDGRSFAEVGYYELSREWELRALERPGAFARMRERLAVPAGAVLVDEASAIAMDDAGRRWRLPKGDARHDAILRGGFARVAREVVTERDLLNCHGTFYELPAENAGGFAKIRPIASHPFRIVDYTSWRGLLVLTGVRPGCVHPRVEWSEDGRAAVWLGAADDLWALGKPVGEGGPWRGTRVEPGVPSDPYLFWGYDRKRLFLSHAPEGGEERGAQGAAGPAADGPSLCGEDRGIR